MEESDTSEEFYKLKPIHCKMCNSKNIRTTNNFRICNRCGFKEEIK